jgi:transitional endoplasmic reticulum ATPase
MSGRPVKQAISEVAEELMINKATDTVTPLVTPNEVKPLLSTLEARVLIWCLRALQYCLQVNRLQQLDVDSKGMLPEVSGLLDACSSLYIPKKIKDVTDLARFAPTLVKQIQSLELLPDAIDRSVNALTERCSMNRAEQEMLLFGIALHETELLETVFNFCFAKINPGRIFKVMSFVLEEPVKRIQDALRFDSFLARSGMLSLDSGMVFGFESRFDVGSGLAYTLELANGDWDEIVSLTCVEVRASELSETDFAHMSNEWNLVLRYLQGSAGKSRVGVNVLLHGPPGCGKTEFARAIISASGLKGYELSTELPDGRSITSSGRRSYYGQASIYLKHEPLSVLLIDEMDGMLDINDQESFMTSERSQWSKASANALLESNPVPSVWITNNPHYLDAAQLRRFDVMVSFSQLSSAAIKKQIENRLGGRGLSQEWMDLTSTAAGLSPGLVNTLAVVADTVKQGKGEANNLEILLTTALHQRGIQLPRRKKNQYLMRYCNASMPPAVLTSILTAKSDARCLLHGMTGTGKTAFAQHVARMLDLEPVLVRPSDILDAYVGGTEKNIANLFNSTLPEKSLIILDEFESLAADRSGLDRNWMVSQVNELLTQLENYEGRVLACTNLVDYIDPAIRRRFQLKVELRCLDEKQRTELFTESCKKLGLDIEADTQPAQYLRGIEQLAYGHYANATEIAQNMQDVTLHGFAALLEQEVESTNGRVARPIGFLQ